MRVHSSQYDTKSDREALLRTCHARAVELLHRNLTPGGILAATPGRRAEQRGYTAIFGRDAAVCAIGMVLSGDEGLARAAATGLHTLGEHQASNGQIPKFVDLQRQEADFWYLGCIDATLWWLIALAFLDEHALEVPRARAARMADVSAQGARSTRSGAGADGWASAARARADSGRLRRRYARRIKLAIQWLLAQEHQRFHLLQQNEASDWADIMPRSGFVLYTNALWYLVKRLYDIDHAVQTRESFNGLFHPFSAAIAEYRRARLLSHYVLQKARDRALYLSYVNFSFFGEEGDVFGNVLAILAGVADARACRRTLNALSQARVHDPYPVRAVARPIKQNSASWRPYMARHRQNLGWQYHNGGIWPMVGGFWIAALVACGRVELARRELLKLARACALKDWRFTEWLHGKTLECRGMPGQSWNAAAFLIAEHVLETRAPLFR